MCLIIRAVVSSMRSLILADFMSPDNVSRLRTQEQPASPKMLVCSGPSKVAHRSNIAHRVSIIFFLFMRISIIDACGVYRTLNTARANRQSSHRALHLTVVLRRRVDEVLKDAVVLLRAKLQEVFQVGSVEILDHRRLGVRIIFPARDVVCHWHLLDVPVVVVMRVAENLQDLER